MIGWTLGRYIFFRYLAAVAVFLCGLASLIFIVDFTQLNERAGALPQFNLAIGLQVSAMRVPMVLIQVIPFVALFASIAMLIQLNRKYELVVARAAGLSAWQFLLPACIGALFFGCATVVVLNPLAARGFAFAETTYARQILEAAGWSNAEVRPAPFRYVAGEGREAVEQALEFLAEIGPASRMLCELPEADRGAARERMRRVIECHRVGDSVEFPAAAWLWSAEAEK